MIRVLADTSIWIDFLNNRDLPQTRVFEHHLLNSEICSCPPIVQEVLQGIRLEEKYNEVKNLLLTLEIFIADPLQAAVESAEMYRVLRKNGVTIRKPNDCLIAWYAIANRASLLHNDSDFKRIAEHTQIKLI